MGETLKGMGVSTGIARGAAHVLLTTHHVAAQRKDIAASEVPAELVRFDAALTRAEQELKSLQDSLNGQLGPQEGDIFGAQALLVRSSELVDPVKALVHEQRVNVETALTQVLKRLVRTFEAIADPYLRERAADIRDVGKRVLSALVAAHGSDDNAGVVPGAIVVAEELLPSVTASLELQRVSALVTERGGRSSHASILARAQGIAAVAGIEGATGRIKTGDRLIVDGISGVVFVNPDDVVEREYDRLDLEMRARQDSLAHLAPLPTVTSDGTAIALLANASKFPDTEAALRVNADGIGLYRTEFGFAVRPTFPTEQEQYEFLKRAAERLHPRPIVFRLLDIGADKDLPYFPLPAARNPSLARRGIRVLLDHPKLLKTQLRAFLRVSAEHPVSILVPVVSGVDEMRRTRSIVGEVQSELASHGIAFNPKTPVGAMIEVPSAALLAPALAREVDFFSLGTNDLIQYVLAADREDERVAGYYQPLHPGVLRLIGWVAEAARNAGRELTICGEMAGNLCATAPLLGLGLRRFSVPPGQLLEVKEAICRTRLDEAETLARRALEMVSTDEVEALVAAS